MINDIKYYLQRFYYTLIMVVPSIYMGWKNLFLSKLNLVNKERLASFKEKELVCNITCPLYSSGIVDFCSTKKEHKGITGCGCVAVAKKWSDSECPLGKF